MTLVDRIETGLRELGVEPLIDRSEIFAFEDWWARIEHLIRRADTIVFVISPASVASEICLREVDYAQTLNKRLAPVVVRAVDPVEVPAALARLNFVFLDEEAGFAPGLARLAEGLATDIDWVRAHSAQGDEARRWADSGRPAGLLLRSPRLEQAESWIAARPGNAPLPTDETRDFLAASRRAATRRRNLVTAALAIGLILALALAGLAYWQRREAITQREAAEQNFTIARTTIDDVIFDLAQGLRQVDGVRISVLRTVLSRVEGAVERLTRAAPGTDHLQRSRAVMFNEFGTTYLDAGDAKAALKAFEDSLAIMRALLGRRPDDAFWQNDLSVTLSKLSDARLALGDTRGALAAMEECIVIRRALLGARSDDRGAQRNLLVGLGKLGEARQRAGNPSAARASLEESLAIGRELVRHDPQNPQWQQDLSFALNNLGWLRLRGGDTPAALALFEEDLTLSRDVVRHRPDDSGARRNLSVSLEKLGDALYMAGDFRGALGAYEECVQIRRTLSDGDPENTAWRRDLSVGYDRIGTTKRRLGDMPGAHAAFDVSAAINRALLARDPQNTQWQRDLAINRDRSGDAKLDAGDLEGARAAYEESLDLRRRLAERDPGNMRWRADLVLGLSQIGDFRRRLGNGTGAIAAYEESLALARDVARLYPDDAERQIDLVGALLKMATSTHERSRQRAFVAEIGEILTRLETSGRLPEAQKPVLDLARKTLATP